MSMVGEVVKCSVGVDMSCWVYKRTRAALDLKVVTLASDKLRNLVHVGHPVDFRI